jgi:enoyl-CoA hydratase/carnithine racemase
MSIPTFETITLSIDAGIALITLNRPEKLNAYNRVMLGELIACFDYTAAADEVRVVILTGAGRAFCSGMDMSGGAGAFDMPSAPVTKEQDVGEGRYRDGAGILALKMFDSAKPIIAAVNGPAIGVGISLQMGADIRLASTTAFYGFAYVRRGVVPEGATSWFLARFVGLGTALQWCLTGQTVSAEEAYSAGLVQALHEPDKLLDAAFEIAREIVEKAAPVSLALTRQMLWKACAQPHPMAAHRIDSLAMQVRGPSEDAREGANAFKEKRAPIFPQTVANDMPAFYPWWENEPF